MYNQMKLIFMFALIIILFSGFDAINNATGGNRDILIFNIQNDVKIKKQGSSIWHKAKLNAALFLGDSIKTGPQSAAVLKFAYPEDNSFHLYENTQIIVADLVKGDKNPVKKININMLKGGTWVKLKGSESKDFKFNLKTPNTVAAISGTALATIVYQNGDTYFCSCDGRIDVNTPGHQAITLTKAQGTSIAGQKPPTPPANDTNILTDKKYKKDPRFGWCIDCHQRIEAKQTTFDKFCVWGVRKGVFPGCCAKNCTPKGF